MNRNNRDSVQLFLTFARPEQNRTELVSVSISIDEKMMMLTDGWIVRPHRDSSDRRAREDIDPRHARARRGRERSRRLEHRGIDRVVVVVVVVVVR